MTETELFEAVRPLLDLYRWRWVHHYNSQRSNAGFPDIVAVRGARLLFIELKGIDSQGRPGALTSEQEEWLDDLRALHTVEVYIWRPKHWMNDTIAEMLK